jgi:predicted nucleic acid-binding Zn ribbon protein
MTVRSLCADSWNEADRKVTCWLSELVWLMKRLKKRQEDLMKFLYSQNRTSAKPFTKTRHVETRFDSTQRNPTNIHHGVIANNFI